MAEPPADVQREFEAGLDDYVADWAASLRRHYGLTATAAEHAEPFRLSEEWERYLNGGA